MKKAKDEDGEKERVLAAQGVHRILVVDGPVVDGPVAVYKERSYNTWELWISGQVSPGSGW